MNSDAYNAWVLSRRCSGDTSVYVTFFTREQGIVHGLYKGGRTPKKQALSQVFTPLWLVMNKQYVRQLEPVSSSLVLSGHNLFAALYINELLHYALRPWDAHPELYDVYVDTLHALQNCAAIEVVLRRFELYLLEVCGYQLSLAHDAEDAPIIAEHYYQFVPGEGFFTAGTGVSGAHLLAMAKQDFQDPAVLKTAKHIMRRAIHHALDGKPIKSRQLYGRTNT
jgi:DNA repair protein RecO (recombination protein O)